MYKNGVSSKDIANQYNVSKNTVLRLLRKSNMYDFLNNNRKLPIVFTNSEQQCILEMHFNGCTYQEIAKKHQVSSNAIYNFLKSQGLTKEGNRRWSVNEYYFDEINTPNKAYCLGLLYSDGCNFEKRATISISLQESDKDILENMRKEIGVEKPLCFIDYTKKSNNMKNAQNQYRLEINSRHMSNVLSQYGVVSNKSLILKWPEFLDNDLYSHFLRGYIDGDGSISKRGYRVSFVGTRDFCENAIQLLQNTLNILCDTRDSACHNGITIEAYIRKQENAKLLLDWIYKDAELYIKRKHDIYISKYCNNDINNTLINVAS